MVAKGSCGPGPAINSSSLDVSVAPWSGSRLCSYLHHLLPGKAVQNVCAVTTVVLSMLASGEAPADRRAAVLRAGQLLEPDDVTFSVMMRGYGDSDPPQWTAISTLLGVMQSRFQMKPSTGAAVHA